MTNWTAAGTGAGNVPSPNVHLKGTINEHNHHPRIGMPGVCEKCCDETERVVAQRGAKELSSVSIGALPPGVRIFDTGATRDTDEGKFDYEAFLSPLVLRRFAEYMHKNRVQRDGSLRDGDNWQKGMGLPVFMKSAWRHFMSWWTQHRHVGVGFAPNAQIEEDLCAVLFNAMGYLHETLKSRGY